MCGERIMRQGRSGRTGIDRRRLMAAAGAAALAPRVPLAAAAGAPTALFEKARAELAAGRPIKAGRVEVDIPRLAENGNSVELRVTVESPMSEADHVQTVHILSEQNPIPVIARFRVGPRSGRCMVHTYVRLATTQNVHAIAEMSDGSLWTGAAESVVLLAACLDGG
jgi:sulfur-oxidizing protein SoxY